MFNNYTGMANPMTMNPSPQTFQNPYLARLNAIQQPTQQMPMQITTVNGRNGADAFLMPPNSRTLLLDETAPIVWLAQTDGAGYKTVTPYNITPYQEAPAPDYSALEGRIQRLEEMLNAQSNVSTDGKTSRSKKSDGANATV